MLKWLLILIGGGVLLVALIFGFFAFMVWNHERGFPKSVLNDDLKGTCVTSKKPFVLLKHSREYMNAKVFDFLPKPEGRTYTYADYIPGNVSKQDGSEAYDLTEAIEVPAGTEFILKDGIQNRTMNGSNYYFWLEPKAFELDSSFIYSPLGISLEKSEDGGIRFLSDEEMAQFPNTELFEKVCGDGE